MQAYEFRMHKADGGYSASCHSICASDRHAIHTARALLSEVLPSAAVWAESRPVGQVERSVPTMPRPV